MLRPPEVRCVLLALLALAGCTNSAPRKVSSLNAGWVFAKPGSETINVTLPHTWNAQDAQDGGDNYFRGACTYRRKLDIPRALRGKRLFLRFEAAATVADVSVNGRAVGQHRGAFTAFCFDITDHVNPGAENMVEVRVDNSAFEDIAPLSGDFSMWGGLYRGVHLLALDPVHISPLDDASPGVYLKPLRVDESSADIEVTARLRNTSDATRETVMVCTITDDRGQAIATATSKHSIAARGDADGLAVLSIPRPRLWDGRRDPYLYQATVELRNAGRVIDRVIQPLGVRAFNVDPGKGLILNGRPYPVRGVNRHQDRLNMGWAVSTREHDEDFELIEEIGATGVRLAHYPHADYVYSLCDRAGFVVWAELPLVNDITRSEAFNQNAKQQLRELIKQNYNHPSILFWSLYNELSMKEGTDFTAEQKLINELNDLAHQLDPTRLTVAATHKQNVHHPVNWIPDATAFNRYWGWYQGRPEDWAAGLDALHREFPAKRIGISEYGAGASIHQQEAAPTKPKTGGPWHPEQWQSLTHEAAWIAMKDRPWLWGTFIWNMFDFAADQRSEGDQPGRNDKGLITYDRRIKKDAFYFYKASWRDDVPVLHITSTRFNPRPTGPAEVKIYSNCDSVELFINGRSRGEQAGEDRVFRWSDVPLVQGRNEVRAVGSRGGKEHVVKHTWRASPSATTRLGPSGR